MSRIAESRREEGEAKNRNHVEEKAVRSCRTVSSGPEEPATAKCSQGTRRYDVLAAEGVRILPEILEESESEENGVVR